MERRRILILMALLMSGCATQIGMETARYNDFDWKPVKVFPTCVVLDEGERVERADELIAGFNQEEGTRYGVELKRVHVSYLSRPFFWSRQIGDYLDNEMKTPDPSCQKTIWLISRNVGDAAYGFLQFGIPLPEIRGATDDTTHSKTFIYDGVASLGDLLISDQEVFNHEVFHLLGCPHAWTMDACYERIQAEKRGENPATILQE